MIRRSQVMKAVSRRKWIEKTRALFAAIKVRDGKGLVVVKKRHSLSGENAVVTVIA